MGTAVLEDFHNYLRLDILLSTYGNFAVRKIFRSRYIDLTGKEWEDCSNTTTEFRSHIQLTLKKTQKIQKESIETGDVNKWDLGTVFLVLRKMCSYKNGYVPQNDSDADKAKIEAENNLITQLIEVRNSLKHSPGKSVCSDDFKLWWKTAAEALLALGGVPREDIDHVRTSKDLHGIEFANINDEAINAQNVETAQRLREDGNIAVKANQFLIAIQSYSKALRLFGLPKMERAILYSNRSYAYLKSLTEVRNTPFPEDEVDLICNSAMEDAETAIDLRPTWFRGYFRQAKVHEFKKEWEPAIVSFDQALGLNMGCEEILKARDECRMKLSQVQCRDHLNPAQMLNQMDTQEYMDKIRSERGTPHFTSKQYCEYMEKLLKSKDPHERAEALEFFGDRHSRGLDGCPQDFEKAFNCYKEAVDLGDPGAMYTLGSMYQLGSGVPINLDIAVTLFEKSIQVCLERNYADISKGEGVAKQQILGTSQYLLARCYQEGLGKPVDYTEAAKIYSRASENSSGEAANNLGSLYCEGQGVVECKERAIQYWKLGARRGIVSSLENLAWTNLLLNNLDVAELHFSYALKANPVLTSLRKTEFYERLNSLRKWQKEAKNDPQNEGTNLLVQLMGSANPPDDSALQSFDDEFHSLGVIDTDLANSTKAIDGLTEMEEKAALGLPYASILLVSTQNYFKGMQIFFQYFLEHMNKNSRHHSDQNACSILNAKTQLLRYFADHYRTAHLVEPLSSSSNSILSTLKGVSMETMKLYNNKKSQLDCNARVCYSSLISNSSKETINFLTVCQRKYPQEIFFPILHSTLLGFKVENKEEDALDVVIKALDQFPGNLELLRLKAELLYATLSSDKSNRPENTKLAMNEIVTAFRDFLRVAPSDHREVPNAHYTIGLLCHTDFDVLPIYNTEYLAKLEMCLRKGLEAEKNLLSRFVPPEGNMKENLQSNIRKVRSQLLSEGLGDLSLSPQNLASISKPKGTEIQLVAGSPASYIQQTDPNRIDSVLRHRNAVKIFANLSKTTTQGSQPQRKNKSKSKNKKPIRLSFTAQPLNTQKLPSILAGLKEIQLEEMDPLTDHVYTGRVLQNATIVEESLFDAYPSIESVLMDSNGEFQRCYFMNLDHKDEKVRKHLSFGSKLSIINPYYRLCVGGGCGIRIEDPQSVVFHSAGDEEPLCRFCLAKSPQHHCVKCKRANYCSKQCQKHDCKILRHRLICKP